MYIHTAQDKHYTGPASPQAHLFTDHTMHAAECRHLVAYILGTIGQRQEVKKGFPASLAWLVLLLKRLVVRVS